MGGSSDKLRAAIALCKLRLRDLKQQYAVQVTTNYIGSYELERHHPFVQLTPTIQVTAVAPDTRRVRDVSYF